MVYLFLFIAILCEVTATTALKAANGFTVLIPSVVTVAGYAGAFYFLSLCLSSIPLGVLMPFGPGWESFWFRYWDGFFIISR